MKFPGPGIQSKPWLLLTALIHSERFNGAENVTNFSSDWERTECKGFYKSAETTNIILKRLSLLR